MRKELKITDLPKYLQERVKYIDMESADNFGIENVGGLVATIVFADGWVDFEDCIHYVATSKQDAIDYLKYEVRREDE